MSTRKKPSSRRPASHPPESAGRDQFFTFEHPQGSGRRYSLPMRPKFGILRQAAKQGNDFDQIIYLLEHVADEQVMSAIDDMEVSQVEKLFTAWQNAMGGRLGDSPRSST